MYVFPVVKSMNQGLGECVPKDFFSDTKFADYVQDTLEDYKYHHEREWNYLHVIKCKKSYITDMLGMFCIIVCHEVGTKYDIKWNNVGEFIQVLTGLNIDILEEYDGKGYTICEIFLDQFDTFCRDYVYKILRSMN